MKLVQRFQTITRRVTESVSSGLRVSFSSVRRQFWPLSSIGRVVVNMTKSRELYRNSASEVNLAGGFVKRIINAVPEFMGLPHAASGDPEIDNQITTYIRDYWAREIQQAIRDSCRDSRAITRFRKYPASNPLVGTDERDAGYLEIVPPEKVQLFYNVKDATLIDRAIIEHEIEFVEEDFDISQGREPKTTVHQIIEEITPTEFRYFDKTTGEELDNFFERNTWGFVPLVEWFNEFESYLEGGQSDLEPVYPFLRAFHDVMAQTLTAHKHHSIPKAVFNINDVQTFLMNNYPDSFEQDSGGNPTPGTFNGKVSWKGTEILFVQPEESIGFLEAKSVLGDSETLLSFLLDCIVIASETPKWVIMLDVGAADKNESLTFLKRINRKRLNFTPYIQRLAKMSLVANKQDPILVQMEWNEIDPNAMVTESQALQQTTMSLELLAERKVISDRTAREHLRRFIPAMKSPDEEARDAKGNVALTAGPDVTPNSPDGRTLVPSGNGQPQ